MRLTAVLFTVLLGVSVSAPPAPFARAQPAEISALPYPGIEIPWFYGWETRVSRPASDVVVYDLHCDSMSANVQIRALPAIPGDAETIAATLRSLKSRELPPGRTRKVYTFDNGFAVLFIGRTNVVARAMMLVTDEHGSSYLSMYGTWSSDSQFRMAIVAQRFVSGVANK